MTGSLVRRLIVLGGLLIIGLISTQSYWLLKTWDIKDQEFDQEAQKMLLTVSQRIAKNFEFELPKKDFIERKASNLYVVNINSEINFDVLEDYLYQEMKNYSLETDFDYSVYDCTSKELVFGNYCDLAEENSISEAEPSIPAIKGLDYYFVVRFPGREGFLLANMNMTVLFSIIAILSVFFFLYAIWIVVRQERTSQLQKDFINNMTHEFKTPISSIKIAADVFTKSEFVKNDVRLSKYASIITEQNQRLNDQVEKVLNIARLEKDSFELKKEPIDINQSLLDIVKNESGRLSKDKMELDFANGVMEIFADPLHFTNVISNIIDNAVKYSKTDPRIVIRTEDKEKNYTISIADNGIGIDREKLKNVFDKFYRVSTGDVHDVKGFGLGLFYVKNICTAHGWTIDVESELNRGTTFSIKIPK